MHRRNVLLGLLVAALPLPALANPAPRWHSISKRRLGHAVVYRRTERALLPPFTADVPDYRHVALKLTGGPLRIQEVAYHYAPADSETYPLVADVAPGAIRPLPGTRR